MKNNGFGELEGSSRQNASLDERRRQLRARINEQSHKRARADRALVDIKQLHLSYYHD